MSVFYERFDRHDHGSGLKGHSTTYCPGCGHGLAHKYLADAIEEMGIQDRTVAVSPVGCSVFLYYYLDVGNTQAAHGRAPAVALGHKVANPESIVISYQGDGDLASIGLAEIVSVAQLGIPITVIFVNNAIYGMTGGQMAPTSLMGQKTATSPYGRTRFTGEPLKVAELMAGLDGPVYVERVALFDAKNRVKAEKAIKKAIRLQVEGKGFSFVEVLAECPTHLKMTPVESEKWVKEKMLPVFPLGVKKDVVREEPWPLMPVPNFMPGKMLDVIGGSNQEVERFCDGFPRTAWGSDVGIKLAGSGGDGAQTAALLIARAAINEGFDGTHIPSYGPESRGGTSYADVRIAEREVLSPDVPHPHVLVAFNAPSLAKFGPQVAKGAVVLYDASVVRDPPALDPSVRALAVPCTEIARDLGQPLVKNIVALGALAAATGVLPEASLLGAMQRALGGKRAAMGVNEEAFRRGAAAVR
jgi:2-oxoisovalerate ferredoxin oxidoreductase beta subunit